MIFFGTKGLTLTGDSGDFFCPSCSTEQPYKRRKVRRFFTLYFIPIIPLDLLGEYIECQSCKNTFNDKVIDIKEELEANNKAFEAEYERIVKKSMAIMVLADGKVDDSEVEAMASIYTVITGKEANRADMLEEMITVVNDPENIEKVKT